MASKQEAQLHQDKDPHGAGGMTHQDKLLLWLSDGRWICGEEFLDGRFFTYSQRASDVNKRYPGRIVNRPCREPHHSCDQYRDEFAAAPKQLALV